MGRGGGRRCRCGDTGGRGRRGAAARSHQRRPGPKAAARGAGGQRQRGLPRRGPARDQRDRDQRPRARRHVDAAAHPAGRRGLPGGADRRQHAAAQPARLRHQRAHRPRVAAGRGARHPLGRPPGARRQGRVVRDQRRVRDRRGAVAGRVRGLRRRRQRGRGRAAPDAAADAPGLAGARRRRAARGHAGPARRRAERAGGARQRQRRARPAARAGPLPRGGHGSRHRHGPRHRAGGVGAAAADRGAARRRCRASPRSTSCSTRRSTSPRTASCSRRRRSRRSRRCGCGSATRCGGRRPVAVRSAWPSLAAALPPDQHPLLGWDPREVTESATPILAADDANRIVAVSPSALDAAGLRRPLRPGRPPADLDHPRALPPGPRRRLHPPPGQRPQPAARHAASPSPPCGATAPRSRSGC